MTDLLHVLPEFDIKQFSHIIPSLEKALITSSDLLILDAVDVAKRAQVPPGEVKRLTDQLLAGLHGGLAAEKGDSAQDEEQGQPFQQLLDSWSCISTLDQGLDNALGGGFAVGHVSEVTGERYHYSLLTSRDQLLTLLQRCRKDAAPSVPAPSRPAPQTSRLS